MNKNQNPEVEAISIFPDIEIDKIASTLQGMFDEDINNIKKD